MKAILVPEFALIGEVEWPAPSALRWRFQMSNIALKPANGNLFPFGLIKILYHQRKIKSLRVMALGVIEEYRTAGVAAGFYATLIRQAQRWVMETASFLGCSKIIY